MVTFKTEFLLLPRLSRYYGNLKCIEIGVLSKESLDFKKADLIL